VFAFKLSLLFVVGMCKSARPPNPLNLKTIKHDQRKESTTISNVTVLKPFTLFEVLRETGFFFPEPEDMLSKDDKRKIRQYLIKHPAVNRKLLKAYLDFQLYQDDLANKVLNGQETNLEMIELVTKKLLEVADTLFEELAEELPFTKKRFTEELDKLKALLLDYCRKSPNCIGEPSVPKFIRDFFETSDIGLTEQDFSKISNNILNNPHNEPVKRKIYNFILDDRLDIDNLISKVGIKGLRKEENWRKFNVLRNNTIMKIANELQHVSKKVMIE